MRDFERYHGMVIRALVIQFQDGLHIKTHDAHGTLNSFLINHSIGLFIKHSAKRITPWVFGFHDNHLLELQLLSEHTEKTFVSLVCGYDGFLTLSKEEIEELAERKKSDKLLMIHVKRGKRRMYAVGGRDKLERPKPRGFGEAMIQALTN